MGLLTPPPPPHLPNPPNIPFTVTQHPTFSHKLEFFYNLVNDSIIKVIDSEHITLEYP